ncbi:hypothetical protein QN277_022517 [Acacia crassicarpa]|uniref:BHLH domain-containing protein n=1 Tax=Acacia crassicarpa TaxID=499986 RepID=A0AAE1ML23_9FABA|nr:hypothetical protein QN277_022517 [Acacia crassicarpa]
MGGNPNLWSNMHEEDAYVIGSSIPFSSVPQNPEPPSSTWSQLLFSGAPGEEEGLSFDHFQAKKLATSWEEQFLNPSFSRVHHNLVEGMIKQEGGSCLYGHGGSEEFQGTCSSSSGGGPAAANWSHMLAPVSSSPRSCVTSLITNNNNNNNTSLLDSFSYKKPDTKKTHRLPADHSPESSTATGGICKKARVQASSSQPSLKVRKEKLGDRISALHQLVSPFGKTDTASVLLEGIGYIRFLQSQIEALCFPYFGNSSKNLRNHQLVNHGERNSVFPEDPGQLLNNDSTLKRNGASNQENGEEKAKDLRSRGLCLVPISLSDHFGIDHNNIGADFWSSTYATAFN